MESKIKIYLETGRGSQKLLFQLPACLFFWFYHPTQYIIICSNAINNYLT